jgi:putative membrane protein
MLAYIKAFHLIAVIAWMAGLLYLPRLFVYHCAAAVGSEQSETFKVMERRLYRGITTPAMIASWIFGLWLAFGFGLVDFSEGWMWLKAALVIALSGVHVLFGQWRRAFAEDRNQRSSGFFRGINEVPTVIMVLVVIAVIVRPF